MLPTKPSTKNHQQDKEFSEALHGKEVWKKQGLKAALSKDSETNIFAAQQFADNWNDENRSKVDESEEKKRINNYADLTRLYYDLVTDLFEYAWGLSFHFCRSYKGEPFQQAIARHQHFLAYKMGLKPNMKVLDIGSGVGGPAREIATFTRATIVGINNNDYQIDRANYYSKKRGFGDKITYVKGDFTQMDFPQNSFDAAYSIESSVHAPILENVYTEVYRVLKPGGVFGLYEWVMTDKYDENNPEYRSICYGIEKGCGIPKLYKQDVSEQALRNAGFIIEYQEDLAKDSEIPWYYMLSGEWSHIYSFSSFCYFLLCSQMGRFFTRTIISFLQIIGLAPKGLQEATSFLEDTAINLVEAGKKELFTPMLMFVARKPK